MQLVPNLPTQDKPLAEGPLKKAMRLWHKDLSASTEIEYVRGLKQFAAMYGPVVPVGGL